MTKKIPSVSGGRQADRREGADLKPRGSAERPEVCPPHDFSIVTESDLKCSRCGIRGQELIDQTQP